MDQEWDLALLFKRYNIDDKEVIIQSNLCWNGFKGP
jgi:hypothetical protein